MKGIRILITMLSIVIATVVSADRDRLKLAAEMALATGDYVTALTIADTLFATDPFDAHMIAARAFLDRGQFDLAETAVRRAIAIGKDQAAARLLLAVVLEHQGADFASRLAYRRGLDLAITQKARYTMRSALVAAQARRKWRFGGSFGAAPSTNLAKVTTAQSFETAPAFHTAQIDGTDLIAATGIRVAVSAERSFAWRQSGVATLSFRGSTQLYEYTSANTSTLGADIRIPVGEGSQIKASYDLEFNQEFQLRYHTARIELSHAFSDTTAGYMRLRQTTWPTTSVRNSHGIRVGMRHIKPLSENTQLQFSGYIDRQISKDPQDQFSTVGVAIGVNTTSKDGAWHSNAIWQMSHRSWDSTFFFLPEPPKTTEHSVTFSVENRNISYFGFSPKISVTYLDRASTTALFEVNSLDAFVGIVNAF